MFYISLCDKLKSIDKNWEKEEVINERSLNNFGWVGFGSSFNLKATWIINHAVRCEQGQLRFEWGF